MPLSNKGCCPDCVWLCEYFAAGSWLCEICSAGLLTRGEQFLPSKLCYGDTTTCCEPHQTMAQATKYIPVLACRCPVVPSTHAPSAQQAVCFLGEMGCAASWGTATLPPAMSPVKCWPWCNKPCCTSPVASGTLPVSPALNSLAKRMWASPTTSRDQSMLRLKATQKVRRSCMRNLLLHPFCVSPPPHLPLPSFLPPPPPPPSKVPAPFLFFFPYLLPLIPSSFPSPLVLDICTACIFLYIVAQSVSPLMRFDHAHIFMLRLNSLIWLHSAACNITHTICNVSDCTCV